MNNVVTDEPCWYTRRNGVVRGPFLTVQVTRHILLGRIRMNDELRRERQQWLPVAQCRELLPVELLAPLTQENQARLQQARLAVDERAPGDRRARQPEPSPEIRERRSGIERRRPEPPEVLRFRELRQGETGPAARTFSPSATGRGHEARWLWLLLALLLLGWLGWRLV
jgi:hypothetical protein